MKAKDPTVKAATNAAGKPAVVYNLNVRGKRGNIVQTYPSVEYDFVPNNLQTEVGDRIHFQWTGSDYNPRRGCNNGEGGPPDPKDDINAAKKNSRADRSNLVLMNLVGENLPTKVSATDINADPITTEPVCTGLRKVLLPGNSRRSPTASRRMAPNEKVASSGRWRTA